MKNIHICRIFSICAVILGLRLISLSEDAAVQMFPSVLADCCVCVCLHTAARRAMTPPV